METDDQLFEAEQSKIFWTEQVLEQRLGHLLIKGDLTAEEVYNRLGKK